MRALVIIPYFGRWPAFFGLYLKSCAYNKSIDILFVTDLPIPKDLPPNVRFHHATLSELSVSFSDILGMNIHITNPYKLCDLKPAYGLLFAEHLKGYDYWAHGDIDLVYGDVQGVLAPLFERGFDIISFTRHWISGSLCLYRNVDAVNRLFQEASVHRQVFESERHFSFCEVSRLWAEARVKDIFSIRFPYDNMTLLVKRAARDGRISAHFDDLVLEGLPTGSHVFFDKGRIIHQSRQYPYFHWVIEKSFGKLRYPHWIEIPDQYFITEYGFYAESEFGSGRYFLSEIFGRVQFSANMGIMLFKAARRTVLSWLGLQR
jgi:hypothetical protein